MIIYPSEISIKEKILAKTTATILADLIESKNSINHNEETLEKSLSKISNDGCSKDMIEALVKASNNIDLMYGSAILASTVMNKNDDVFLPDETWEAIPSAINTPFNDNHEEKNIIGHIIDSKAIDKDGKQISQKNDYFDVLVDFAVYKGIYPSIAQDIAEKGPIGKKCVSMEAIFKNFDYLLVNPVKGFTIVQRNKDTAFLTQYLRAYGGTGQYQNEKIGRVLRDFRFVGMGNVDDPANPRSEYTKIDAGLIETVKVVDRVFVDSIKGNIMKFETIEQAVAHIEDLNKQLKDLQGKNQTEAFEKEITSLKDQLSAETSKLQIAQQRADEVTAKNLESDKKYNELKAQFDTIKADIDKINKEKSIADRLAKAEQAKIQLDDNKRKVLSEMSDEAFQSVINFASDYTKDDKKIEDEKLEAAKKELEKTEADKKEGLEALPGDVEDAIEKTKATISKFVTKLQENRNKVRKITKNK